MSGTGTGDQGRRFAGIMPPLITPLDAAGEPDEAGLRRFVDHAIDGGVTGLVLLGSSGEAALLTSTQRRRVLEVALDAAGGRVPVVAGTGEPGTTQAAQTTRLARELGAAAAIVVPPFYYQIEQEAVRRHYRTVREVGGLPLLAYHIPGLTKAPVQTETLLALAEEGTLEGMKDSGGDFGYYQRAVDGTRRMPHFAALQGSDAFLLAGLFYGGDGAISVMSQVAPRVMVGLYRAAQEGDWERARALHRRYQRVAAAVGPGWVPALKGALSALGICAPHVAPPNAPLSEERLREQRERILAAQAEGLLSP